MRRLTGRLAEMFIRVMGQHPQAKVTPRGTVIVPGHVVQEFWRKVGKSRDEIITKESGSFGAREKVKT